MKTHQFPMDHHSILIHNQQLFMIQILFIPIFHMFFISPKLRVQDGRPVGLQVLAPYGADATVLRAAAALERCLALPKGTEPRRGTAELRTEGPRTTDSTDL